MIGCRYRDMRRETSYEIKSMWYNLGEYYASSDFFACIIIYNTQ